MDSVNKGRARVLIRMIPGIIGVLLILNTMGYLNIFNIIYSYYYLLFIIIIILFIINIYIKYNKYNSRIVDASINQNVIQDLNTVGRVWKAFELEFTGSEDDRLNSSKHLARMINDRANIGDVRYSMLISIEGGFRRNILILSSDSRSKLDIEKEVFKTIISSTIKGVRIREIDEPAVAIIANAVERLSPSNKGYTYSIAPLISSATSERPPLKGKRMFLGRIIDAPTEKYVYLYEEDVVGHIGVFGSTGSGKSTTLAIISARAWRYLDINVVILDWSGEYRGMLSRMGVVYREYDPLRDASVNPLSILDQNDGLDIVVDVMNKALELSEPQSYMLMKILESKRARDLTELEYHISSYDEDSRWDREVKRGLLRKLGVITRGSAKDAFRGQPITEFNGLTVINLDSIRNTIARSVYIMTLLAYNFAKLANEKKNSKMLFVIDEAHNVFKRHGDLGFMDQLIAESRKYGMYLAIATQSPSLISNSALLNTNTKIIHSLKSARDKNVIADTLSLSSDAYSRLDKLYKGEALIQAPSLPEPIFISIELDEPPTEDSSKVFIG